MDYLHVQADKHDIPILYHLHSVDLAHHEIFRAKVGKGGIKRNSRHRERLFRTLLYVVLVSNHISTRKLSSF